MIIEYNHCNIVLHDKQRKEQIVMTDENIVMKGNFMGDQHCEDTHSVEHVWLPMPHHHKESHWHGQESRQFMNYALPERRASNEQHNLSRLIFMLTQPTFIPMTNHPSLNYPQNIQEKIQRRSSVDAEQREDQINRAFEKHLNKLTNDIEED